MTKYTNPVVVFLFLISCAAPEKETVIAKHNLAHFNQVNTLFTQDHIQCLYAQYNSRTPSDTTYKDVGIVMSVIDDIQTYQAFFSCNPDVTLPSIDFRTKSLLIGMRADFYKRVNTPIKIKKIIQTFAWNDSISYSYIVTVAGSTSESQSGGEWFGFTALVTKVQKPVQLHMSYVFN